MMCGSVAGMWWCRSVGSEQYAPIMVVALEILRTDFFLVPFFLGSNFAPYLLRTCIN